MPYITIETEIDLDDYKEEISRVMKGTNKTIVNYVNELDREFTMFHKQYHRSAEQILDELKKLVEL